MYNTNITFRISGPSLNLLHLCGQNFRIAALTMFLFLTHTSERAVLNIAPVPSFLKYFSTFGLC